MKQNINIEAKGNKLVLKKFFEYYEYIFRRIY